MAVVRVLIYNDMDGLDQMDYMRLHVESTDDSGTGLARRIKLILESRNDITYVEEL